MALTNFIPEVWSAQLLVSLKKALVYGGPGVVNRDYEGEISQYGDTVHINSVSRPTIGTYTAHTDITIEDVDDADRTLTITQSKYFAFEVDDIEKRQARADQMGEAAREAAYGLRDVADQYLAGLMKTDVDAGNALGAKSVSAATDAEQLLVDLKVILDEDNVPDEGRWAVITPKLHGKLLRSELFVPVNRSGTSEALRNGIVGRAFGFDILLSNNAPAGATTGKIVVAGSPIAVSYAEQIAKTEAFRMEKRFADGLKGLHLYGAKVVRPTAVATADVTVS
jgi:hypothetical protein